MPEKSGFFDSTADDPREYAARDFAEYFARFVTNGVFNAGQYLNVSASGSDANVSLSPGFAWINGYVYSVYDSALTLPIQPATTQDRIDRVILRLDTSVQTRKIRALVVQGLPSTNSLPPALVRSGSIYDISLAQVRVVANSSIILPGNITDERLDQNLCGLVNSLIRVDTTKFQKQFDDFMASIQGQSYVTGDYVKQYVDGKTWQKRKLTEDNGLSINISNGNANNLVAAGFYVGENVTNAPTTAAGAWWYIEVQAMSSESWVIQKAHDLFSPGSFRMRIRSNGTWTAWSDDLFISVADGKSSIATAISGKGVPTSPTDPFATMAANIGLINTGKKWAKGSMSLGSNGAGGISGLGFTPRNLILASNSYGTSTNGYMIVYSQDVLSNEAPLSNLSGLNNGSSENISVTTGNGFINVQTPTGYGGTYNYLVSE